MKNHQNLFDFLLHITKLRNSLTTRIKPNSNNYLGSRERERLKMLRKFVTEKWIVMP